MNHKWSGRLARTCNRSKEPPDSIASPRPVELTVEFLFGLSLCSSSFSAPRLDRRRVAFADRVPNFLSCEPFGRSAEIELGRRNRCGIIPASLETPEAEGRIPRAVRRETSAAETRTKRGAALPCRSRCGIEFTVRSEATRGSKRAGVSLDSTSGSWWRESAAPPPGTSVRVPRIGPRIASRRVTQSLILSVSQERSGAERSEFRPVNLAICTPRREASVFSRQTARLRCSCTSSIALSEIRRRGIRARVLRFLGLWQPLRTSSRIPATLPFHAEYIGVARRRQPRTRSLRSWSLGPATEDAEPASG